MTITSSLRFLYILGNLAYCGPWEGRSNSNEVGEICPLILIKLVYLQNLGEGAIVPPAPTLPTALIDDSTVRI